MKKAVILAPVFLALLALSCKKVEQQVENIISFTVNVSQVSKVPPPTHFHTALPKPVTIITNSSASLNGNNTNRDRVKNVYLDRFQLTLVNPPASAPDFDFLDTLRVYINTPNVNNRILLGHIYHPALGQTTLTLTPTTARLDEYLKSDKYELSVYSRQSNTTNVTDSLSIRSDARFKVTAATL